MLQDLLKAKGSLNVVLTGADGVEKTNIQIPNLVVNTGLAFVTSRMIDTSSAVMSHMAIGTSNAAAMATQTGLTTEVARVALTSSSRVTTTVANDSVQYVASFGPGHGTGAITEAGVLNAASAGTMLCRTVFNVINKDVNDTLTITWKVVLA